MLLKASQLLLSFALIISLSYAADTISVNQSLSGDQTIISKGENFELGFFSPGSTSNYYIGMWYKKVTSNPPTIVWVANRETPISDHFNSELKIIEGNLVLLNESKSPIWSTNVNSTASNSVIAVLLDDGNLVLRDGSNSTEPIWQSFDYPAHTWLPGAKIAYNNRTGRKQLLTSWKSEVDPAVGPFSLEIDPLEKQLTLKWKTIQYWASGSWNGQIFGNVPEMRLNDIYNYSFVRNENKSYFTYSLYNPNITSRIILIVSGDLKQLSWLEIPKEWAQFWSQRERLCDVYAPCGAFGTCNQDSLPSCNCLTGFVPQSPSDWSLSDFSGGCVRATDLQCGRFNQTTVTGPEKQSFLTTRVTYLPANWKYVAVGSTGECRETCLNNCSCNAFSFDNNGCSIWDGELLGLSENDNGKTIYIKVARKDLPDGAKNNRVVIGDTISVNKSLSGDQTIISKGENFELGFFSPGSSSKYYIGMWYKKVTSNPPTIVWVANRETPISDHFNSELKIIEGNLVLLNESKSPIWSTNVNSTASNSVIAVLLDDGNLVLRDGSNSTEPIWQSFDYPAHTWLPGAKIAYNNRTGRKQLLTSWKSEEDPAVGLFSLEIDPLEKQLTLKWKTIQYWTSGSWNGQIFGNIPEMMVNDIYNYSFVRNENESYFTYSLYNPNITSRIILIVSGDLKQLSWLKIPQEWAQFWSQRKRLCDVYAPCGAFGTCNQDTLPSCNCLTGFVPRSPGDWGLSDFSGGCVRATDLQCGRFNQTTAADPEKQSFLTTRVTYLPANWKYVPVGSTGECRETCLNNCSCNAFSFDNNGCSIWDGELLGLSENNNGKTIYIKVAQKDLPDGEKNNRVIIGTVVGSIVVMVLILGAIFLVICRRKKRSVGIISRFLGIPLLCRICRLMGRRDGNQENQENFDLQSYDSTANVRYLADPGTWSEKDKKGIDVPFFEFKSILAATGNFSIANKLGQGGFGPVYKGILPGGAEIAVKRLSSHSGQGLKEFKNEVLLIAKLQHRNLVRLLGYSMKEHEMILIYEYLPNKSLDGFIFDRELCIYLDWAMRFDIILGIARGLLYLHQDSRLRIIHRDLKTSNILLDEDMNPKISDFGLAKIVKGRETEASTNRVIGTYGYMSPEYALDGLFSIKSDVFSFGVVVLEIISGKRNTGYYQNQQAFSLLGHAWSLWKENKPLDLMDQALLESCNSIEVTRCITIGLLCVQEDPNDRPTMTNVVLMLGADIESLPNPKEPAFVSRTQLSSSLSSFDTPDLPSINKLTITAAEGR